MHQNLMDSKLLNFLITLLGMPASPMDWTGSLEGALPAAGIFPPATADKNDEIGDRIDMPKSALFSNGLQIEKNINELLKVKHSDLIGEFFSTVLTTQTRGKAMAGDAARPADIGDLALVEARALEKAGLLVTFGKTR